MLAQYLIPLSSFIILSLCSVHLYFTFFTTAFTPRDQQFVTAMKKATIPLAKGTNLWKAWIGFNGSHSAGGIFYGLLNMYLAINFFTIYETTYFLHFLNIGLLFFFVFLAKKYWFKTPLIGISIATICYLASAIILFF